MKLPIPSDEQEGWICIEVQWPNSPLWIAYLQGWLSQFARGRIWEENTGSILAVMAIGKEIWLRNQALVQCSGEPLPPPPPDNQSAALGGLSWENFDMPCLDISNLIDLHDGHLWVMNGCCEWVDKGAIGDFVEQPIDDDPGAGFDPPIAYNACGKANAIIEAIYAVAHAMFEASDLDVWDGYSFVADAVKPITVKSKFVIEGIIAAFALKNLGYDEEDIFEAFSKQEVLCKLARSLTVDTGALSQTNINTINDAFNQNLGFETAIFGAAGNAIGLAQLSNIATMGQLNDSAECDCPEPPVAPHGLLHFSGDVTKLGGKGEWAGVLSNGGSTITITWAGTIDDIDANTQWQGGVGLNCDEDITHALIRFAGADTPINDWHATFQSPLSDVVQPGTLSLATETLDQPFAGTEGATTATISYTGVSASSPTSLLFGAGQAAHMNPKETTGAWSKSWVLTIIDAA